MNSKNNWNENSSILKISEYEIEHFLREKEISVNIIFGWTFIENFKLDKSWDFEKFFEFILEKSLYANKISEKRMFWLYEYDHFQDKYIPVMAEKL